MSAKTLHTRLDRLEVEQRGGNPVSILWGEYGNSEKLYFDAAHRNPVTDADRERLHLDDESSDEIAALVIRIRPAQPPPISG